MELVLDFDILKCPKCPERLEALELDTFEEDGQKFQRIWWTCRGLKNKTCQFPLWIPRDVFWTKRTEEQMRTGFLPLPNIHLLPQQFWYLYPRIFSSVGPHVPVIKRKAKSSKNSSRCSDHSDIFSTANGAAGENSDLAFASPFHSASPASVAPSEADARDDDSPSVLQVRIDDEDVEEESGSIKPLLSEIVLKGKRKNSSSFMESESSSCVKKKLAKIEAEILGIEDVLCELHREKNIGACEQVMLPAISPSTSETEHFSSEKTAAVENRSTEITGQTGVGAGGGPTSMELRENTGSESVFPAGKTSSSSTQSKKHFTADKRTEVSARNPVAVEKKVSTGSCKFKTLNGSFLKSSNANNEATDMISVSEPTTTNSSEVVSDCGGVLSGTGKAEVCDEDAVVAVGKESDANVTVGEESDTVVTAGKESDANVTVGEESDTVVTAGKESDAVVTVGKESDAVVTVGDESDAVVTVGDESDAVVTVGKESDAVVTVGDESDAVTTVGNIVKSSKSKLFARLRDGAEDHVVLLRPTLKGEEVVSEEGNSSDESENTALDVQKYQRKLLRKNRDAETNIAALRAMDQANRYHPAKDPSIFPMHEIPTAQRDLAPKKKRPRSSRRLPLSGSEAGTFFGTEQCLDAVEVVRHLKIAKQEEPTIRSSVSVLKGDPTEFRRYMLPSGIFDKLDWRHQVRLGGTTNLDAFVTAYNLRYNRDAYVDALYSEMYYRDIVKYMPSIPIKQQRVVKQRQMQATPNFNSLDMETLKKDIDPSVLRVQIAHRLGFRNIEAFGKPIKIAKEKDAAEYATASLVPIGSVPFSEIGNQSFTSCSNAPATSSASDSISVLDESSRETESSSGDHEVGRFPVGHPLAPIDGSELDALLRRKLKAAEEIGNEKKRAIKLQFAGHASSSHRTSASSDLGVTNTKVGFRPEDLEDMYGDFDDDDDDTVISELYRNS